MILYYIENSETFNQYNEVNGAGNKRASHKALRNYNPWWRNPNEEIGPSIGVHANHADKNDSALFCSSTPREKTTIYKSSTTNGVPKIFYARYDKKWQGSICFIRL